jgi:membrane associated rhomboid family serine protease
VNVNFPKPGAGVIALLILNAIAAAAASDPFVVLHLMLVPAAVLERGEVWQPLSAVFVHPPGRPFLVIIDLLMLYWFGTALESWWKTRRLLLAYAVFGVSGMVLTLLAALVVPSLQLYPFAGAPAAILGMVFAWALVFGDRMISPMFMKKPMRAFTFISVLIAAQIFVLAVQDTKVLPSHLGALIGAAALCGKKTISRVVLRKKKRDLEEELRVIQGGKPMRKKDWN